MYTRNYRIQHGDRRPESPQNEDLRQAEVSDSVSVAEAFEALEEQETLDAVTAEQNETAAEVEAEESVSALSADDSKEPLSAPRPRLRAVKRLRVRLQPIEEPCADDERDLVCETSKSDDCTRAEEVKGEPETCARENENYDLRFDRRFSGRNEKHSEKKPLGALFPPLGLKNFSAEDIFLCAILLLLLNEGCEDIMTLILGFLLIS